MRSICRHRLQSITLRTSIGNQLKPQQTQYSARSISSVSLSSSYTRRQHLPNSKPISSYPKTISPISRLSYSSFTNMDSTGTSQQPQTKPEENNATTTNSNNTQSEQQQQQGQPLSALPALPAAGDGPQTLEVGGAAIKLDHLGPLVVNEDGTMSRIANWDKMVDIERENTLRILGKRNQMRLAKLRVAQAALQKPEGEQENS